MRFCLDVLRATSSQEFLRSSFNNNAAKAGLLTSHDDTSGKAAESSDGIKEESFQSLTFPNATDRREETSFSPMTEGMHQNALVKDTEIQPPQTDLAKKNEAANPKPSSNLAEELDNQNLEEKIPSNVKRKGEEGTSTPLLEETEVNSNKNNEIQLQQADVPERLLEGVHQKALVEDTKPRALTDLVKKNKTAKSKPSDNLAEKLDKQNLEEKIPSYVKKTSKEFKPSLSQETEVNTVKNNEIQSQQADVPKRFQEAASRDVGSSRSIIAEKIKSFSPKLAGEPDKQVPPEKNPRNIRKMISVFESSISQDRVPLKPLSTKSYRVGTLRLLKDHAVKYYSEESESSLERLENSKISSSTRLRNSFSTGDLQKNLSSILKTRKQVGFDNNVVEPSETNMQSKGMVGSAGDKFISADPKETEKLPEDSTAVANVAINNKEKFALTETNTKELPTSPEQGVNNEEKFALTETKKTSKNNLEYFHHESSGSWIFPGGNRHFCITAQGDRVMSLLGDCMIEEKSHQEKTLPSIPESIVTLSGEVCCGTDGIMKQDEEMLHIPESSSPKSSDEEASTGSLGQAIKIALVVGFGVLVLLLRQREPGEGKKKENNHALKTRVFMNKRGSIEEQLRKIDVLKLS